MHVGALSLAPLWLVQAVISAGLVFLAIFAKRFSGFHLGRLQWIGLLVAAGGLKVLGLTATPPARDHASAAALIAVEGAVVALSGAVIFVSSRLQPRHLRKGSSSAPPRRGVRVFTRPLLGAEATLSQLAAWAVQILAAYAVLNALNLQDKAGLAAAAAILLAVNFAALVPVTPSNIGIFQAATIAVLAAYGVDASHALAYGILLQAIEITTAIVLGVPALINERISLSDIRRYATATLARHQQCAIVRGSSPPDAR